MRLSEKLRLVFINIIQNKAKVFLTSIGIIAGAATIVAVIAIGKGGEADIKSQFSGLSAETIYVKLDNSFGQNIADGNFEKLTLKHMEFALNESTSLSGAYLRAREYKKVKINGQEDDIPIMAVSEMYSSISNLKLAAGNNIDKVDVNIESNAIVLGYGLAKEYFLNAYDAIGQYVKIDNKQYEVIGVLERSADGLQGLSPDDTIFMPYSTASAYVLGENTVPEIVALAKDISIVNLGMAELKDSLDYLLEQNVYKLEDTGSRMEAASKSSDIMNLLLVSISIIVFIIGGIGIMNVLTLSVKERTKEIGVLKALGCTEHSIMQLFLLEAIIISAFGGIIGVLISNFLIPMLKAIDVPILVTPEGQILGLSFAILTGTIFGSFPAYKASKLEPVNALNYE